MQATASHGLKPGVRLRLWYWLDRPVCGNELKYGLREAPGDPAILGAAQAIYTAAPLFLPGAFDPLLARIEMIPGDQVVMVPPPDLVKPSRPCADRLTRERGDRDERALAGLIRSVARAANGTRNSMLYWASRRIAHRVAMHAIDPEKVRALLEEAALQAGLSANEAAATVRSGLRHGDA